MNKSEAKRMAWARAAAVIERSFEDWELNPKKYTRHDQIRFEEATEDVIKEMTRRSERKATGVPDSEEEDE